MNRDTLKQFIRNHTPASSEMLHRIVEPFEALDIPLHGYFLEEGQVSRYMFLETGYLRAFTHDPDGSEVTTNFYLPGQVVFEVSSFFSRTRSRESIQALTACSGFVISFETLNQLFHEIPAFREFGRAMLVKGFVTLKQRTLSLIQETAEERYAGLLRDTPELLQQAPLRHIASYLGITDTSLSRIRKTFSRKG